MIDPELAVDADRQLMDEGVILTTFGADRVVQEREQRKDLIQHFHDYQVEWLKSHYDIELEPQLEELIVRFLHDTANSFMMEMDREKR